MNRLIAMRRLPLLLAVTAGLVGACGGAGTAHAEDLFEKFKHTQVPLVVDEAPAAEPTVAPGASAADIVVAAPQTGGRHDLARFFPNLRMAPILAETPAEDESEPENGTALPRDFAAIVEESKREALTNARRGSGSIAASMPGEQDSRGTAAGFASFSRPNCRHPRRAQQQPCPPVQRPQAAMPGMQRPVQPGMQEPGTPRIQQPAQPGGIESATADAPRPAAPDPAQPSSPDAPATPVVPLPDAADLGNAVVPPVPGVGQAARGLLARSDIDNERATWSDSPNLVGDGCAPQGSVGRLAVGRSCIFAPNATFSGANTLVAPSAQIGVVTNGQFNNVQAVQQGLSSSSFVFPYQPQGAIPTASTMTTGAGPAPGIVGVPTSPSNYLTAANTAFQKNPPTNQYANLNPQTVYDPANSGAIPVGSGTAYNAYLYYNYVVDSSVILPGYAVGFVKLTENNSPIPRDRAYMTYSYFNNANFYPTKADVNRFMPGFEKTFFDGFSSVEIRTPFAATLSNRQDILPGGQGVSEYRDIQFGNMSVIFKTFLWEERTWAISGGMQVMLPTANNTSVYSTNNVSTTQFPNGQPIQQIFVANESVHLMPFIGAIWAPNDRFFNQMIIQYETDANGNLAYVNNNFQTGISGRQLTQVGRIYYPDFLYMGFGTGYWLYKDNTRNFTGFSPIMEIHVNQGLNEFCPIQRYGYQLGPQLGIVSVTNALVGCNFEWGERSTLTFAYVTPLGGGVDRYFDGELRALYNLRFGPQNRLTRAQF